MTTRTIEQVRSELAACDSHDTARITKLKLEGRAMMAKTTQDIEITFVPVTSYTVTVPNVPTSAYSDKLRDMTYTVDIDRDGFRVSRLGEAKNLEKVEALIREDIQEMFDERAEYVEQDRIKRAAWKQYDKDLEVWTAEQMDRAEMVPVTDIVDGEIAGIISKGEIHTAFQTEGVYNETYYSKEYDDVGRAFDTYRLYDDHTWHADDRAFDRYVKVTSKVRAIREFTRPMPVRP